MLQPVTSYTVKAEAATLLRNHVCLDNLQGLGGGAPLSVDITQLGTASLAALAALAAHLFRIKASTELVPSSAIVPYEV